MANITLSNFRTQATIEGWPMGGSRRATAVFTHEIKPGKGQRIARVTTGKPKYSTYCHRTAIADGSDGKTYIIGDCHVFLSVMHADMKYQAFILFPESPEFAEYRQALLDVAP